MGSEKRELFVGRDYIADRGFAAEPVYVADLDQCTPAGALSREMERLHLSSRRLIWLNPLLRWDGFAPKAAGIRAMLPHVDSFRAGHSIASLEDLAQALSRPDDHGDRDRLLRMIETAPGQK